MVNLDAIISSVKEVLLQKSDARVWQIEASSLVTHALKLMSERNIGALLVVEGHKIVGIFSERDYLQKVAFNHLNANSRVREVMNPVVACVELHDKVSFCMALMTDIRTRHLPVLDNGILVGLISMGDIVKTIISDQEHVIEQLTQYIVGPYPSDSVSSNLHL